MDVTILQWFETIRCAGATAFFGFFSFLGEGVLLAAAVALFFWLAPTKTGERFAVVALSSLSLNAFLKCAVARPRPYVAGDVSLLPVDSPFLSTTSLTANVSFPSGHVQLTTSFLAALSARVRKIAVAAVSFLVLLLVACSRMYFGVHYPSDVLAGFLLGVAVGLIWSFVYDRAYGARYFALCACALLALAPLFFSAPHDYVKTAGLLSGAAVFLPVCDRLIRARLPVSARRLWRVPLGAAATAGAFFLTRLFPAGEGFALLSYFLTAGAATAGANALFRLFRV